MARSVADIPMAGVRRSGRTRKSSDSLAQPSGSEYSAGDASPSSPVDERPVTKKKRRAVRDDYMDDYEFTQQFKVEVTDYTTSHGRQTKRPNYIESDDDAANNLFDQADDQVEVVKRPTRSTRSNGTRGTSHRRVNSDDDGEVSIAAPFPMTRSRKKITSNSPPADAPANDADDADEPPPTGRLTRARSRLTRKKSARERAEEDGYTDVGDADAPGSSEDELMEEAPSTPVDDDNNEEEPDTGPRTYGLRARTKQVNYAIPPPLEEMRPPEVKRSKASKGKGRAGPGWSANGTVLSRYMGMPGPADDSDSDVPTRTPRKPFGTGTGAGAGGGLFAAGGGGLFPDGLAAAGTPSNLGKVNDAALADADPLGVNQNVTFDEIGGLDDHINSLKEMTLLPLLYPEVFQRFNLVPPRGVLFHGPPGTGKTLLARALAASCRANGRGISFFMRKGADVLSKWVGEAERQLRLLFEEARNQQPSIIFFDEIDGLAPVRSSKQDQIHASMVSTLLALMDGMDGRGQVVVIGATNRPDAVDPALRRPGRFDREFYFPLPNLEARARILTINTRKWEGWDTDKATETIQKLAKITKGYGGADLRALCTEAALNAVQRRYPQIYKSTDRLLLKPETIGVQPRDFMISVKKLIPSSARATGSSAAPLPSQLVPLLDDTLQRVKTVLEKAMPLGKKRTALEEAEFEDEDDDGALEREILMQKMETLRVYRPRVVLHGDPGMGQSYVGAAALHHLEGFHIQSLDLGSLMGDSTRTVEAGIVQLFVEAKRHQPSVIYIPSLKGWCAAVSETARTTVKAMLDTLSANDPILLLAVVDGSFLSLPRDVRAWFGMNKENRIVFTYPDPEKRRKFFDELLDDIRRPPTQFPDGVKRKKRVLEELPIAPPLEPRQPTAAELALQEENDQRILTLLKFRLGPILAELKRKHKRFTKPARDEYNLYPDQTWDPFLGQMAAPAPPQPPQPNGIITIDGVDGHVDGQANGTHEQQQQQQPAEPQLYEVDLETMSVDLYKGKFLTPSMFLEEVGKMVYNAEVRAYEDRDRLYKAQAMYTATEVSVQEFDPAFRLECERMAGREMKRRGQRRAEKEKMKSRAGSREGSVNGHGSGGENGVLRRSARNNGQKPELGITDPLLLERRLKRHRSQDVNGDVHASGEDSGGDRDSKRSKLDAIPEDSERDELDIVGPTSSQPRPQSVVRFAPVSDSMPQTPSKGNLINGNCVPELPTLDTIAEISSQPRSSGFDPNLLNPASPTQPLPSVQSLIANDPSNGPGHASSSNFMSEQPTFPSADNSGPHDFHMAEPITADEHPVNPGLSDSQNFFAPEQNVNAASLQIPTPRLSPSPGADHQATQAIPDQQETMVMDAETPAPVPVERTPSPPPPPFHVSSPLLLDLEAKFVERTDKLNVEQLEQLRATALNSIWRHRQEWDRDACVRELFGVIEEFVEEATDAETLNEVVDDFT
ncbi:AAA-domain-containing protein [Fomitiporia mediterranea MF3/22]|uniref:AAA-domain-containing protein n=1 Tax=Fomitiporia mediterranea (strain MF3/22) TaxID=694068 RepID=UPI0004407CFF|nr:AAA-domain-containing protein [Fomitiporia mediterranea MF3/22]EJD00736.1 AAA-domain-containing protein [Fomitiporia mediterranea MF3/22]